MPKVYECLDDVSKEEIIGHLAKLVVSGEKDEAAINFDVTMYGLMLSTMAGGKNFSKLKRHVVSNANTLLSECATIPDVKAKIPELKELTNDNYWNAKDILKFEETRKSLRDIMKFIPPKKVKIHYTDFEDEVVFREEGRKVDMGSSDFEDYRAKVNEYVEAHKNQPAINKLEINDLIENHFYLLDVKQVILKNWSLFDVTFIDKVKFENFLDVINKYRIDAHAKTIEESDLLMLTLAFNWFDERIEDLPV